MQYYQNAPNYYVPAPPCMSRATEYKRAFPMPNTMTPEQFTSAAPMVINSADDQYAYPQNVPGALALIRQAVQGENEDRLFYEYLIKNAPNEEDKKIIEGIKENEMHHFNLFRGLYLELTGQMVPQSKEETFNVPGSYCEGLRNAIIGEQNAVIKYRKILFALQDRVQINKLTEIITDEIRHGILYNYLFSKNGCRV